MSCLRLCFTDDSEHAASITDTKIESADFGYLDLNSISATCLLCERGQGS